MNLFFSLAFLIHFSTYFHGNCTTHSLQINSQTTLVVPGVYVIGFAARAFVLETSQPVPNFRAGISVEAVEEKYVCSFDVFLGGFKVWSSSHLATFFTSEKCVLSFTRDGDLLLTGHRDEIGWRTATYGQGIKRVQLSNNGNLILVDEFNIIKWQSFHFPTNVMLFGQTLDIETKLTSFPKNNSFFSFEIHREKLALYLNSGKFKYSYWEFNPKKTQKISFIRLATNGLQLFNDKNHKIAQIPTKRLQLLRFLAVENTTGNLGFYFYSMKTMKFEPLFQSPRNKCDHPSFCKVNEICTFSNKCSFLGMNDFSRNFCGKFDVDMKEIQRTISVLKDENKKIINATKKTCLRLCIEDCTCVGAMFVSGNNECYLYGEIRGLKEVNIGNEVSFMVKVMKNGNGLKKWEWILIVAGDGIVLFGCLGGMGLYILFKKKKEAIDN